MIDKSFLEKVEDLAMRACEPRSMDGKVYAPVDWSEVKPDIYTAKPINVGTLTALVDLWNEQDRRDSLIHVSGPGTVSIISRLDERRNREVFAEAMAATSNFQYGVTMGIPAFIIALQTSFTGEEDRQLVLDFISKVDFRATETIEDNGVSQEVTLRASLQGAGPAVPPNPVSLCPFETFAEINQPCRQFVFRMQKSERSGHGASLHDVDSPLWRSETIDAVKGWLRSQLGDEAVIVG